MQRLAEDLYAEVLEAGGTISGEHACGLSRTAFIRQQYGELYDLMVAVKQIFDPQNLRPGKVIGDAPDLATRDLRPVVSVPEVWRRNRRCAAGSSPGPAGLRNLIELQLNWDPGRSPKRCVCAVDVESAVPRPPMCECARSFVPCRPRKRPRRAKANLIRGVLTGQLELSSLTSDEFKAVADLCVNCHMCGAGVPRQGGHSQADAGEQRSVCGGEWAATFRLDLDAIGLARQTGRCDQPPGELGDRQSADAVADGEDVGDCPGTETAAGHLAELHPPRAARRRLTRPTRRAATR